MKDWYCLVTPCSLKLLTCQVFLLVSNFGAQHNHVSNCLQDGWRILTALLSSATQGIRLKVRFLTKNVATLFVFQASPAERAISCGEKQHWVKLTGFTYTLCDSTKLNRTSFWNLHFAYGNRRFLSANCSTFRTVTARLGLSRVPLGGSLRTYNVILAWSFHANRVMSFDWRTMGSFITWIFRVWLISLELFRLKHSLLGLFEPGWYR